MKRWKKILHNCPYLVALLITWLFITAGGIALMIYRNYGGFEWKTFWASPFFAVIMEEEMNGGIDPGRKISAVISGAAESYIEGALTTAINEEQEAAIAQRQELALNETTGQTLFTTYTPVETDSIYYSDAGKVALTTDYPYTAVEEGYFDDAVFFGDSRTLGISDYSGLNADFFCENGMTIYKLLDGKGVVCQETGQKMDLNQVLQEKQYGKIYIMLGMNELGYRDTAYFLEQYGIVLEQLRQWQPEAVIYIQANLHVSREKNNVNTEFNNININDKNAAIATLADGKAVFYLDINPLFTDNEGYLREDLTFDGVHLHADGYIAWKNFLMEHAVARE